MGRFREIPGRLLVAFHTQPLGPAGYLYFHVLSQLILAFANPITSYIQDLHTGFYWFHSQVH